MIKRYADLSEKITKEGVNKVKVIGTAEHGNISEYIVTVVVMSKYERKVFVENETITSGG